MRRAGAVRLLGDATLGRPRRVLACAGLLLVVAAVVAGPVLGRLVPFSSDDPGSQSVAARHAIERATGRDPYYNLVALVRTPSGARSPAGRAAIAEVARVLAADPGVAAVSGGDAANVSFDGRSAYVEGVLRARPANSELDAARRVEGRLQGVPGVTLGGVATFYAQGNDSARHDLVLAELFAFPLLLLIALWVFRGLVAAVLPLAVGAFTIVCTLALLRRGERTNGGVRVRAQHHDGAGARPGGGLQPADRLALPRGDRPSRSVGRGAASHDRERRTDGCGQLRDGRRDAQQPAGVPAAVPALDRDRRHPRLADRRRERARVPAGCARAAALARQLAVPAALASCGARRRAPLHE